MNKLNYLKTAFFREAPKLLGIWALLLLMMPLDLSAQCANPPTIPNSTYLGVFDNKHFFRLDGNRNCPSAATLCAQYGGRLPKILNNSHNSWLLSRIGGKFWIGYSDAVREGSWRYQDGSVAPFTRWSLFSPSILSWLFGNNDYCYVNSSGSWEDCDSRVTAATVMEIDCAAAPVSSCTLPVVANSEYLGVFDENHYYHVDGHYTFAQGNALAAQYGGTLPIIRSAAENAWLDNLVDFEFYLGITDVAQEGVWRTTTGELAPFTFWEPGEPDNSNDQDYAQFTSINGDWEDRDGDHTWGLVIQIACTPCPSDPPNLSSLTLNNTCPSTTVNLTRCTANNMPVGSVLTWHSGTPATAANRITNISAVGAGTYYASFFNAEEDCFSGDDGDGSATKPVTVTIGSCGANLVRNVNRTLDGTMNNISNASTVDIGSVGQIYDRVLPATYPDGIGNVLAGQNRPNPRRLSNKLSAESEDTRNSREMSGLFYQWGQFIDHDFAGATSDRTDRADISLPSDEKLFSRPIGLSRVRFIDGVNSPRQQVNTNTIWIDGSQIYGTDADRAAYLRTFKDGKLRTSKNNMPPYNTLDGEFDSAIDLLAPEMEDARGNTRKTFVVGDIRAAEHPGLTSFHTLFIREHNRYADRLIQQGMTDDEEIYQAARKWVGALIQQVTYGQWVESLGVDLAPYSGYKPGVKTSVFNSFATAAYRWHTMVENDIILRDNECQGVGVVELALKDVFFNLDIVNQYDIGVILKGLSVHQQYETDIKVNNGLRNFLNGDFGTDLVSINIQRGRDHGLPDYNSLREFFTGSRATSFEDITGSDSLGLENAKRLDSIYTSVDDIDAWVGLYSEPNLSDKSIGKTVDAIFRFQFENLRDGDYYYFENDPALAGVLNEIKSTKLSDIISRNSAAGNWQDNIFFVKNCSSNPESGLDDIANHPCNVTPGFFDWEFIGQHEGNNYFRHAGGPTDFEEARALAFELGGDLPAIESSDVSHTLAGFLAGETAWLNMVKESDGEWYRGPSLNDLAEIKRGEEITYFKWDWGEPNNAGGNEDRGVIKPNGRWNDVPKDALFTAIAEVPCGSDDASCPAGKAAPTLQTIYQCNVCPSTTLSLATIQSTNTPLNVQLTWHTGTPATNANRVFNINNVAPGFYYAAFFKDGCYAGNNGNGEATTRVKVERVDCCDAGNAAPLLSVIEVGNLCPAETINLTAVTANNRPNGTVLTWHTAAPATEANKVAGTAVVAGTYFAAFEDNANGTICYSPVQQVAALLNADCLDTDMDGIPDAIDLDDDNDGILDVVEDGQLSADTDGDGIINSLDLDSDNDGINDVREVKGLDANNDGIADGAVNAQGIPASAGNGYPALDMDGDLRPNAYDLDSDADGINDLVESGNAALVDANGDGMVDGNDPDKDGIVGAADGDPNDREDDNDPLPADTDGAEMANYLDLDSDNDGLTDLDESGIANADLLDQDNDGKIDNLNDADGDGIAQVVDGRPNAYGDANDPNLPDADNDNVPDYVDPFVLDTDMDGIADAVDLDDDNDGILDVIEDGQLSADTDGDGIINSLDLDSDNDGINDVDEAGGTDVNRDGIADGPINLNGIPNSAGNGLMIPDTDGDLRPNPYDLDSDADGINDLIESGNPALVDANGDGVVDGNDPDMDGIVGAADGDPNDREDDNDPAPVNTDGADMPDYLDLDSDNDGMTDLDESGIANAGLLDQNNDGKLDNLNDADGDGIAQVVDGMPNAYGDANNPALPDVDNDNVPDYVDPFMLDTDMDGVADAVDLDDDNDGILDTVEDAQLSADTDGDGIPNSLDLDSDNDGINDVDEAGGIDANRDGTADGAVNANGIPASAGNGTNPVDTDGDLRPNPYDLDSDADGINDLVEKGDPALVDANGDGVVDGNDPDMDGIVGAADSQPNNREDNNDPAPVNTDGLGQPDYLDLDSDDDGLTDLAESGIPNAALLDQNNDGRLDNLADLDGDGIAQVVDGMPNAYGDANNPALPDEDADNIPDYVDGLTDTDMDGIADAVDLDDDNDGILDTVEDAQLSADTDGDGIPNSLDLDSDNDGINDVREVNGTDVNNDGIADGPVGNDGIPASAGNGSPTPDTDGDQRPNPYDLDSDNDGINDLVESGNPALVDANGDGVVDGNDPDNDGIVGAADGQPGAREDANDPLPVNTDGADMPDYLDLDSDNDGLTDLDESGIPNADQLDQNNDGVIDNPTDTDGDGIAQVVDGMPNAYGDANNPALPDEDGDNNPDYTDVAPPSISIADVAVDETAGTASVTVTLSNPSDAPVSVFYFTNNGTALGGADYTTVSGTLTIPAGSTTGTISVPVLDDVLTEGNETFVVNLTAPNGGNIVDGQGTVTIMDDETPQVTPSITIGDLTVNEGAGTADVIVSIDQPVSQDVTVDYTTANGSAVQGNDYTPVTGTVTIPAGQTSATISVPVLDDNTDEQDEVFAVNLSGATGGTITDSQGLVTILDDDAPQGMPNITIDDLMVNEGAGTADVVVSLDQPSNQDVTVNYVTANGTADGTDFTPSAGTVTIPAGQTSATITIPVLEDTVIEQDETFTVNLNGANGGNIADSQGVVTIMDNDGQGTPSITIGDLTVNEDDGTANVVVSIDQPSNQDVTVDYVTANGSAVQGNDYTPVTGTVTIPAGQTSATIPVPVLDDNTDEQDEVFAVNLSGATGGTLTDSQAIVTILDDDAPQGTPNITIDDLTVNEGAGTADVIVSLDQPSNQDVTVNYVTANGTADGTDFTPSAGTVTIPAGQTSATISIPVSDDTVIELDETFAVNLNGANGGNITDSQAVVTIMDNDAQGMPNITIGDLTVDESAGTANVVVSLDQPSNQNVTVNYVTANGTADGTDFTPSAGTVTIPAGQTSATISIPVSDDTTDEPDETFAVNLNGANGGNIADSQAIVTILDNDDVPGGCNAEIVVTGRTITVNNISSPITLVKIIDNTWNAISECTPWVGAGCGNSFTYTVPANGTYYVQVQTFTDWSNQVCNILETVVIDGNGGGMPVASAPDVTVDESAGTATVTVNLTQPAGANGFSVNYITMGNTATTGSDFSPVTGTLFIQPGQSSGTIIIPINDDSADEPDETFNVNFSSPNGGTLADNAAVVTIIDNDTPTMPNVTVSDLTVNEDAGTADVVVSLSQPAGQTVTVSYSTSNGSATQGNDFTPVSGTVSIPAGQTSAAITVPILDDTADEQDETFTVNLNSANGGNITDAQGVVTILDNDDVPGGCNAQIVVNGRTITVNNIASPITLVKIIDNTWNAISECTPWSGAGCGNSFTYTVPTNGTYFVQVQTYTDWSNQVCNILETVVINGNGGVDCPALGANIGDTCNDGNPNTINDVVQGNCTCAGTPVQVCDNVTNGGLISGDETICPGDTPSAIQNAAFPSGGSGAMEYIWLSSTTSCPSALSQAIPGATGASYQPGPLSQTTYFRRCARRAGCIDDADWLSGESNCVVKTVEDNGNCNPTGGCNATYSVNGNTININGITAPISAVKIMDNTWKVIFSCDDWTTPCNGSESYTVPSSGTYWVQIQTYQDWSTPICNILESVSVGGNQPRTSTLLNLNTTVSNNVVEMDWTNNSGSIASHFELERSVDGQTFENIGDINTAGTDDTPKFYTSSDKTPLVGFNYYRLKLVNLDGNFVYSNTKRVTIADIEDFGLFPNPAQETINVSLGGYEGKDIEIHLIDQFGKRVQVISLDNVSEGTHSVELANVRNGIYSLWIFTEGRKPVGKKMIVNKMY